MSYRSFPLSPAATAIAALLALSPFQALAQVAEPAPLPDIPAPPASSGEVVDPALAPPVPLPATGAPAPAQPVAPSADATTVRTPVFGAPQPVVQPVPEAPPETVAAPAPGPAAEPVSAKRTEIPVRAGRPALPSAAPETSLQGDIGTVETSTEEVLAPPVVSQSVTEGDGMPAAAPAEIDRSDDLATAGGLGLAALAAAAGLYSVTRRRRRALRAASAESRTESPVNSATLMMPPVLPASTVPLASASLATERATTGPALSAPSDRDDLLRWRDQMVAEVPSPQNPFLTRRNRLRRANFLLRQAVERAGEAAAGLGPKMAGTRAVPMKPKVSYSMSG